MVLVNVYLDQEIVNSQEIPSDFYILKDAQGEVFWKPWEDPREGVRKKLQGLKPRGGVLLIWCTGGEDLKQIRRIPPDWDLWVNGKKCPKGSYNRFALQWFKIDLVYGPYRFEFISPNFESGEDVTLPLPSHPYVA